MFRTRLQTFQFLRFCMVGVGNTAVDFVTFFLLTQSGMTYMPAQIMAYSAGIANSFILNRRWTFQVAGRTYIPELCKFIIVNGIALLVSSVMLFLLHDAGHFNLWLSKAAVTCISVVLNFIGSRIWVFAGKHTMAGNAL